MWQNISTIWFDFSMARFENRHKEHVEFVILNHRLNQINCIHIIIFLHIRSDFVCLQYNCPRIHKSTSSWEDMDRLEYFDVN